MKGRPREFDLNTALEQAMLVFWRNGYEGTSLSDLTEAMQINRPSLYAAFGDKERLFFKVLERYIEQYGSRGVRQLGDICDIQQAIATFFSCVVEQLTNPQLPPGCLIANTTLECGSLHISPIGRKIAQCHAQTEATLYQRLRRAQLEGQLPVSEDVRSLAQFFNATMLGMGVLARTQSNPVMIQQIAATAMRVLP